MTGADPDLVTGGHRDEMVAVQGGAVHLLRGGSGPPLLYLHGGGATGVWRRFHGLLAERFTVIAPDHPGFGRSDALAHVDTVGDLAAHTLDLVDRLELERPLLAGASFGGWIAAELALLSPQRFRALVLLASIGLTLPGHPITPLFPRPRAEALGMLFCDRELARRYSAGREPGSVLGSERDGEALARFLGGAPPPALEPRLERLALPTLVIWGDADRVVPAAHGARFAERVPHARLLTIPSCGHGLPFEAPEAVADAIALFSAEPDAAPRR